MTEAPAVPPAMILLEYNPQMAAFRAGTMHDAITTNRQDLDKHQTCPWVAVGWCEDLTSARDLICNLGEKYGLLDDANDGEDD